MQRNVNMATIGGDDRLTKFEDIPALRRSSVVSELRAIQKHAEPVEKAHEWAEDLVCLRHEASHGSCLRKVLNGALQHRFVAVSWTRQPSAREDSSPGRYSVMSPRRVKSGRTVEQRDMLNLRNSVLDRTVKYLKAHDIDIFWIDKACIDQANPIKQVEAIHSMDLVYKNATQSVGLLSSPIYASTGAQLLTCLDGDLSFEDGAGDFHFCHDIRAETIPKMIHILEDLVGDTWWGRAWIYQEEYLSSLRMDLLIPVKSGVRVPERYGVIAGEFCVQATRFREQATIFLLACFATEWERYHVSCAAMLSKIGNYSITLKRTNGGLKPMSATIFADIKRQGVENAWNTLAITANRCAYRTRLNVQSLVDEGRSLSLCLLAQFLLNGEIIACGVNHNRADRKLLQHTIDGVLHQIQPVIEDLPISTKGLTFLKHCRLPPVEFVSRGLKTVGYIWHLPKHANVHTNDFDLAKLSEARRNHLERYPWESRELEVLASRLKQGQEFFLAAKLCAYLDKRRNNITSPALDYMDLMACKLFQAIDRGLQLRLASLPGQCASGIFIPRRWELSQSMNVLTTWQSPQEVSGEAGNAVSLRVSLRASRVVIPTRWINGMVFFSRNEHETVIISWPLSWTKQLR
jgi:hypothetical protein